MRTRRLALLAAVAAAPAAAQPVQFSAILESKLGYVTNPFFAPGVDEGSLLASASIAPKLVYVTARSNTTLQAKYDRETYPHKFGYTDSATIGLQRTDQLSQFLGSVLSANYQTSNRATINDPQQLVEEPFDLGQRTRSLTGSYQLQWQATAHDQLSYSAGIHRTSYGRSSNSSLTARASNYTQYSVDAGYNRVVDARTSVGATVGLSTVRSKLYPDSRTVQPSLTAKRQLSAVWEVDAHVGLVFQHIDAPIDASTEALGFHSSSTTSLGYGAQLCGVYPLTHLCLSVNHQSQPSGFGPLRTQSSIGGNLTRELDAHSRITVNAQYMRSSAASFTTASGATPGTATAILASADYDRDLTQRISAGIGGRYQQRDLTGLTAGRSYAATIHVRAKLGRM